MKKLTVEKSWLVLLNLTFRLHQGTNHIDHFQRSPSQLRGYVEYLHHLKKTYSSVLLFIQHERLKWVTITPSGDLPFENPFDFKTLCNDWPYLVEDGIEHLVVWTKFLIDDDAATGKVTKEAEEQIEAFIRRTFCEREDVKSMNRESIVWFKNWKSIKSVHALGKCSEFDKLMMSPQRC